MGREIRRVPPNWEHPKSDFKPDTFKPLYEGYEKALANFQDDINEKGLAEAIEYNGGGPQRDEYVDYKGQEPTWFQVYETVSEGTPVTPPFATREELVDYLVANGDFWDQSRRKEGRSLITCDPWPRKQAESFVMGDGWAPSLIMAGGVLKSGVEAIYGSKD